MKRNAATQPHYDAAGGRVLPDGSHVDFVLFMPGDHFEYVDDDAFEDAAHEDRLATEDTSVAHLLRPIAWQEYDCRAHFDAEQAARAWEDAAPYESHSVRGWPIDDEELETIPEPRLEDDVTRVRARPTEGTWWEAAKRGLRAITARDD